MTETSAVAEPAYTGWAIVELMGHRKTAGFVSEVVLAGVAMLRVDTPGPDGKPIATQFYGGPAIYCLTPCDEQAARDLLSSQPYNLPPAIRLVLPRELTQSLPSPDDFPDEDELGEGFS